MEFPCEFNKLQQDNNVLRDEGFREVYETKNGRILETAYRIACYQQAHVFDIGGGMFACYFFHSQVTSYANIFIVIPKCHNIIRLFKSWKIVSVKVPRELESKYRYLDGVYQNLYQVKNDSYFGAVLVIQLPNSECYDANSEIFLNTVSVFKTLIAKSDD